MGKDSDMVRPYGLTWLDAGVFSRTTLCLSGPSLAKTYGGCMPLGQPLSGCFACTKEF